MKSWIFGVTAFAAVLIFLGCTTTDPETQDENDNTTTTTTQSTTTTTTQSTTTTTTQSTTTTTLTEDEETQDVNTTTTTTSLLAGAGIGPPPVPLNLTCLAGENEGELLIEWDAPLETTNVNKVRLYVSVDGGAFKTNRTIPVSEVDTTRADNTRWAAAIKSLPVNVPIRVSVTAFNAIGKESPWHVIHAHYVGVGEDCGSGVIPTTTTTTTTTTTLPDPTGTAGF
ncbi:MAG: hypothetical protein OXI96_02220 [Acidimicrobiaceae bacterium]|nr:hypothetical protein [Acidimicrobiaceae bacterium]